MGNLAQLPNKLEKQNRQCRVIIETPKGCRNKFDYDPEAELFGLGGLLPAGLSFPYDFGFIPSTLGDDGDPLDVMIFMEEPAHVGCLYKTFRRPNLTRYRSFSFLTTRAVENGSR